MLLWIIISHLFAGLILSFIGSLPFGLINITTSKISIEKGVLAALWFALGASIIELLQAFISISFAGLLIKGSSLSNAFEWFSFILFLMLGTYYLFFNKTKAAKENTKELKKGRLIISGISVSALNFMVFPYWIFYFTYLKKQAILSFEYPMQLVFAIGVGSGTFLLLWLYAVLGKKLMQRFSLVDRYINKIIGIIFIGLAVLTFFQI